MKTCAAKQAKSYEIEANSATSCKVNDRQFKVYISRLWIAPDLVDLDKSATSAGRYGPTDTYSATKCEKKASNYR